MCVCLPHGGLGACRRVQSPDGCYGARLLLLAASRSVTFHGGICMCLTACVCPWEESVKGQEEQPLGNTGSSPEATHRGAGCQGVTNPNPWSFLAPLRAQPGSPSSSLTPIYPRSPPGRGTLTLREQGSFVPGSRLWRVGTPGAICRVGEGGRNSRGMLGMLMM